ncbi:MAG: ArsR/SmtB family transcription factor [Promethearchaeota archaeon]
MKNKKFDDLIISLSACRNINDGRTRYKELKNKRKLLSNLEENNPLWTFCNVLGNKTRVHLLELLIDDEYCVCELAVILNKAQPTISHHLRILEKANLIRAWKKGKFAFYVLIKEELEKRLNLLKEKFLN